MINSKSLKEQIERNVNTIKNLQKLFEEVCGVRLDLLEDDGKFFGAENEFETAGKFDKGLITDLADMYYKLAMEVEEISNLFASYNHKYIPKIVTLLKVFDRLGFDKMDKSELDELEDLLAGALVEVGDKIDKKLKELWAIMNDIQGTKADRRLIGKVLTMAGISQSEIAPYKGVQKRQPVKYEDLKLSDLIRKLEKAPDLVKQYGDAVSDYANGLGEHLIKNIESLEDLKRDAQFIVTSHRDLAQSYGSFVANALGMIKKIDRIDKMIFKGDEKQESKVRRRAFKEDSFDILSKKDPELYDLLDYLEG